MGETSTAVSGGYSQLSPLEAVVATSNASRVTVRALPSMETIQVYSCVDKIDEMSFSPDGEYILCGIYSRNTVQVFSVADGDWKCRINEGAASIVKAAWAPDSRNLVTVSDFGIQLSIWSLTENASRIIANPKADTAQGFAFSTDGCHLCVLHRVDSADHIGVYDVNNHWEQVSMFKSASNDAACVKWSSDDQFIIVVDSILNYRLGIYRTNGDPVAEYSAYNDALGIQCVAPQRHHLISLPRILAVGSSDEKIRLISERTWNCVFTLPLCHPNEIPFALQEGSDSDSKRLLHIEQPSLQDDVVTFKQSGISKLRSAPSQERSSIGLKAPLKQQAEISWMEWSADNALLACRSKSLPQCLWIWSASDGKLVSLIVTLEAITCAQWQTSSKGGSSQYAYSLAFCTRTPRVYFYEETRPIYSRNLPEGGNFGVKKLSWNSEGNCLLLQGEESLVTMDVPPSQ